VKNRSWTGLKSNVDKTVQSLSSPESGIVSYHCDGLEGVFSVESLNNLSVEDIKKAVDENKIKEKSLTPPQRLMLRLTSPMQNSFLMIRRG